jgi:hypothetical protein
MSGKPPAHPPARKNPPLQEPPIATALYDQAIEEGRRGFHNTGLQMWKAADNAVKANLRKKGVAAAATHRAKVPTLKYGGTRRNKSSGGDLVTHLLTIRNQIKLYHWQTGSFARHKATDDLTAALDTNIDAFVESYMGRYGRPSVSGSIKLHNFSESAAKSFVARETTYLQTVLPRKIGKDDTDLLNLRDTILGDLTKVSYLFTLH